MVRDSDTARIVSIVSFECSIAVAGSTLPCQQTSLPLDYSKRRALLAVDSDYVLCAVLCCAVLCCADSMYGISKIEMVHFSVLLRARARNQSHR
jgi:hypothetical protein